MRTSNIGLIYYHHRSIVGMKPLSERDENVNWVTTGNIKKGRVVGMKPLSERDENSMESLSLLLNVIMK